MNTKQWEEEFNLEFNDCEVVHVYDTEQFKKVKQFISKLLEEKEKELQTPEGVSQWRNFGIERGYYAYFKREIKEEIRNSIINSPKTFGIIDKQGRGGAILIADILNLECLL